jgi:hypothetical protein
VTDSLPRYSRNGQQVTTASMQATLPRSGFVQPALRRLVLQFARGIAVPIQIKKANRIESTYVPSAPPFAEPDRISQPSHPSHKIRYKSRGSICSGKVEHPPSLISMTV